MAHDLESMLFVGETPWHGLGTRVDGSISSEEAIKKAGLDWQVKVVPLFTNENGLVDIGSEGRAVMRMTDNRILGVVGDRYEPLQNSESFSFFNDFIIAKEAEYHTAGSLKGGRRVWILASLNSNLIEIGKRGDVIKKFLLLSNSHDGTMSVRVGFTPIRVVCANTLAMAHNNDASHLMRVKHTAKLSDTMKEIKNIVSIANQRFEATADQYRFLSKRDINKADLKKYITEVFYPNQNELSQREESRKNNIESAIMGLFDHGRGVDVCEPNWWRAYNAVNEYLNYNKAIEDKRDQNLNSLWFGSLKDKNEQALKTAVKMAA